MMELHEIASMLAGLGISPACFFSPKIESLEFA